MRTLFLQAPSFDGFDGGAGSRYQAKREISSFWYPTWLAQPAALVPDSKLIDAPPASASRSPTSCRRRADYDLAVLHTSTPSFASDVSVDRGAQSRQPAAQGRVDRRQSRGRAARRASKAARADRFRRPQRIRLHDQGGRRRPGLGGHRRPVLSRRDGAIVHNRRAADPRKHGRAALRHARSTSAT